MAKAAMTSGTFPVIDQDAFLDAQRKLCPAWPFC
jgi:hypothetical protein